MYSRIYSAGFIPHASKIPFPEGVPLTSRILDAFFYAAVIFVNFFVKIILSNPSIMSTPANVVPIAREAFSAISFCSFGKHTAVCATSLAQVIYPGTCCSFPVNCPDSSAANNKGSDIPSRVLYELLDIQHPPFFKQLFKRSFKGYRILLFYPKTEFPHP